MVYSVDMENYQQALAEMLEAMKEEARRDHNPDAPSAGDAIVEAAFRGLRAYMDRNEIVFYQP
jgi:hypothetical protein